MALIKQTEKDFVVWELQPKSATGARNGSGEHAYFWLTKQGLTTFEALQEISDYFEISKDRIGFAGAKDRNATTTQLISIRNIGKAQDDIRIGSGISLEYAGQGEEPLGIGQLLGNKFRIVIRGMAKEEIPSFKGNYALLEKLKAVPNYFDEQRFSRRNAAIGKALATNNLKQAVAEILGCNADALKPDFFSAAAKEKRGFEAAVAHALVRSPTDFNAALRMVSFRLRKLFIHAYQAYLFNTIAARHISESLAAEHVVTSEYSLGKFAFPKVAMANTELPVVGFATEFNTIHDKKLAAIVADVLKSEGITPRTFLIKSMPELSSEGGMRSLLTQVKNLSCSGIEPDEMNKGKKKCTLSFSLDKGCYATIVVKALISTK